MLEIQGDVFLFGGHGSWNGVWEYNLAIYQLSCSSGICSWATLNQELKVGRKWTVAIPVPDSFCFEEGDGCNQDWIGDDECDDINNNVDCNFDGGDCCLPNVNTQYCTECLCLE